MLASRLASTDRILGAEAHVAARDGAESDPAKLQQKLSTRFLA